MSSYKTLFDIAISHTFFSDGRCSCLDLIPSEETTRIINNAGLVIKKSADGIVVLYDEGRFDALRAYAEDESEPLCFTFKAYTADPQFKSYSEPFDGPGSGGVLYFDNRKALKRVDEKIRLHTQEFVSNMNSQDSGSPEIRDILSQKDRLTPPIFVVRVYATGEEGALFTAQFDATPQHYYLSFKARQTFWKYYLLGSVARKNAYIFDQDGGVEFESAGETSLADARSAQVFISKVAMPLRQKQSFRFQLKERGPSGDKVLIKRLPVASTGQFGKEVVSGQGLVVSEIFINC